MFALSTLEVGAQSFVTNNHDEAKMNQITVQETGKGGLTPAFYYDAFHRSYQHSAASKNKLTYRSLAVTVMGLLATVASLVDWRKLKIEN